MRGSTVVESHELPDGRALFRKIHEQTKYVYYETSDGKRVDQYQGKLLFEALDDKRAMEQIEKEAEYDKRDS